MSLLLEAQGERRAGLHHRRLERRFLRHAEPAVVRRHEDEAEIVHIAVVAARLERLRVPDGLLTPPAAVRARLRFARVHDPKHAGQKAVAPVRPGLTGVLPEAIHGVHRVEVRVALDETLEPPLHKLHGAAQNIFVNFRLKINHRMPL